ncbi:hypothetical protein VTK26DRAFT_1498 [Humicola hyalothermophila]
MPPFFDQVQIYDAIQNQANPILEALAANDHLRDRSLRRFDRDDPPPYESSTESEDVDNYFVAQPLHSQGDELPEELTAIMEQPITDDEMDMVVLSVSRILCPIHFYHTQVEFERDRVQDSKYWSKSLFRGLEGSRRLGVIARHNVKRRWEKLGVWNPEWGFPGRKVRTSDDAHRWQWHWKQQSSDNPQSDSPPTEYSKELIRRALDLRRNLRRGESAAVIPLSRLEADVTASQAESFLISRPWVLFQIEIAEEKTRYLRLDVDQQRRYPHSAREQVIKWWKQRGDWREEYDRNNWVTSWKWRHESPSPEPEDLTPIGDMETSPLEATEMDFTPSEIDDLETIELPRSQQPKLYWTIEEHEMPPYFPGQRLDVEGIAERKHQKMLELYGPPRDWEVGLPIFGHREPSPKERSEVSTEERNNHFQVLEEDISWSGQAAPEPPPQASRRRGRAQSRGPADNVPNEDQLRPQLRRSARISAMKRAAESLPSKQEAEGPSNKRRKLRTTSNRQSSTAFAAAPEPTTRSTRRAGPARAAPARSPPPPSPPRKTQNRAQYKRGRTTDGSSAKGQGVERSRSAVMKKTNNKKQKPAKSSASAGAAQQRSTRGRSKK